MFEVELVARLRSPNGRGQYGNVTFPMLHAEKYFFHVMVNELMMRLGETRTIQMSTFGDHKSSWVSIYFWACTLQFNTQPLANLSTPDTSELNKHT